MEMPNLGYQSQSSAGWKNNLQLIQVNCLQNRPTSKNVKQAWNSPLRQFSIETNALSCWYVHESIWSCIEGNCKEMFWVHQSSISESRTGRMLRAEELRCMPRTIPPSSTLILWHRSNMESHNAVIPWNKDRISSSVQMIMKQLLFPNSLHIDGTNSIAQSQ